MQCKLIHALAFFQWRYLKARVDKPKAAEEQREIFESRVKHLIGHLEHVSTTKKKSIGEARLVSSKKERKHTLEQWEQLKRSNLDLDKIKEQKKDLRCLFYSIPIDKSNKVSSFEQIGLTEPNATNTTKTVKWLKSLSIEEYIYPANCYDDAVSTPPTCIFVPEVQTLAKMIETVGKHSESIQTIFAKFNFFEQPKPQWLIEQEKIKKERMLREMRAQKIEWTEEDEGD